MNSLSGRNNDPIPAGIDQYQRRKMLQDQVRKLRKSPDTSRMYSIQVPALRATYYQKTLKLHKVRVLELQKMYPGYEIIINK